MLTASAESAFFFFGAGNTSYWTYFDAFCIARRVFLWREEKLCLVSDCGRGVAKISYSCSVQKYYQVKRRLHGAVLCKSYCASIMLERLSSALYSGCESLACLHCSQLRHSRMLCTNREAHVVHLSRPTLICSSRG